MLSSLDSLVVPPAFARHDKTIDTTVLADSCAWKLKTELSLNKLDLSDVSAFSVSELADLVRVLAPLTAVAQWSSPAMRLLASARLARIPASAQLIAHILTQIVKPLFVPTPHPRLHISTARILPRPADVQDTYIEQPWKDHPGLDEVIRWCLLNTESSAYETAWPLFLPPVMTVLDDYQVLFKLLGVRLVSDMLTCAPPDLLLRTGVDELMFTSLIHSLSHLGDRSTPDFIQLAVKVSLQLIDLTTPSAIPSHSISPYASKSPDAPATAPAQTLLPSQSKSLSTRFSRLSTLLSSSLLGTVIMYTPTFLPAVSSSGPDPDPFADPEHADTDSVHVSEPLSVPQKQSFNPTLVAAAQSLPAVLSALGIGGARFLKGVIPVLSEWLALPIPVVVVETGNDNQGVSQCDAKSSLHHDSKAFIADVTLHCASLSSLSILFCTCAPQMGGWSATIVHAVGRCWVGCVDIESYREGSIILKDGLCILKKQLKETAAQLAGVCPAVAKDYATLLAFDKPLFEPFIGGI